MISQLCLNLTLVRCIADIFAEVARKYPYLSVGVNLGKVCASLMNSISVISGNWQITYIKKQEDREVSGSDDHPI